MPFLGLCWAGLVFFGFSFFKNLGPCPFDGQLCYNILLYKLVLVLCFITCSSPWYLSMLLCNGRLRVPVNAHNHGFFHYFSQKAITYFPVPAVDFTRDLTPTPCPTLQLEEMVYSVFSLSELCKFFNKWAVTLVCSIKQSGFLFLYPDYKCTAICKLFKFFMLCLWKFYFRTVLCEVCAMVLSFSPPSVL